MSDFIDDYAAALVKRKVDGAVKAKVIATAIQQAMKSGGLESIVVDFDGSGDSGSVGDVIGEPANLWNAEQVVAALSVAGEDETSLRSAAESLTYELLEANHGGWEINEGSIGEVTITQDTVTMHFGQRVESVEYEDYDLGDEIADFTE